jgi:hypothetical protein
MLMFQVFEQARNQMVVRALLLCSPFFQFWAGNKRDQFEGSLWENL